MQHFVRLNTTISELLRLQFFCKVNDCFDLRELNQHRVPHQHLVLINLLFKETLHRPAFQIFHIFRPIINKLPLTEKLLANNKTILLFMTIDSKVLRRIGNKMDDMFALVNKPSYPTSYNQHFFLLTERDTLLTTLSLVKLRSYKESFILLRTVLEKFLFFWLMLQGRKYRWTETYNIIPKTSQNSKEARDKTLELWKKERKLGSSKLKNAINIQASKKPDNQIYVTFEEEGLFNAADVAETGEVIPIYNLALERYRPEIKHIADVKDISEGKKLPKELSLTQKGMYHHFFYIDNIFRNLIINNLVTEPQLKIIRVHYNFLSTYVHPGRANIEIWKNLNPSAVEPASRCDDDTFKELIFLYAAKFMHLYIKVFVMHYKSNTTLQSDYLKYEKIINQLDSLSKDLWFFDNKPTQFDREQSNEKKRYLALRNKSVTSDILYYENPLERLQKMRKNNQ